ncbi:MAG: hypothetical protein ACRED3_05460, partial [Bradyrhizobium sp.]
CPRWRWPTRASRACSSCSAKFGSDLNDQGGGGNPAVFLLAVRTARASKPKIFAPILIPSEPTPGMVVKIWIFDGPLTQSVTVANHI